jgi:membrane-bound transcription factor site-1 protease
MCCNLCNLITLKYHPAEIAKLREDVANHQLSVVVIGDWYNVDVMKKINFYDDNAKQWWTPLTGGANVPAINDLLENYGIILGNNIYDGEIRMGDQKTAVISSFVQSILVSDTYDSILLELLS